MRAQNLDGVPYIDAKTYQGWKQSGFQVKKGEKSTLNGIVWLKCGPKNASGEVDDDSAFLIPKLYHLFHRSQVEAL